LVSAAQKYDRSNALAEPLALDLTEEQIQRELRDRVYVSQLKVIAASEDDVVSAVSDFLRASISRTAWSEKGDVVEESFQAFEDALTRAWKNQRSRVEVELKGRADVDRGQLLLAHCLAFRTTLQSMEVPGYFVPGSFHVLADALTIGWHPRFKDMLKGDPAQATSQTRPSAAPGATP
jgi:hypothetical protein